MHLHVQSYPLADWRQDPRVLGMSPFLCWPCGQGQALAFHTTVDEVTQRRRGDRPRNTLNTNETLLTFLKRPNTRSQKWDEPRFFVNI